MCSQQQPRVDINDADMTLLTEFMAEQFDPKLFVIRERYKFWSDLERKPGETITQLAARIRQDALTCSFRLLATPKTMLCVHALFARCRMRHF